MSKKIKFWHKFYSLGEEDFFDLRRFSKGKRHAEIKRNSRHEIKRNSKSQNPIKSDITFLKPEGLRDYGKTYREEMLYFLQDSSK